MSKIFVLGSINYDLVISTNRMPKNGETISGFDYFESVGGKGGNQAAASAKLGSSTYLIGSVGRDYHGQTALNTLQEMGVKTDFISVSDDEHTGIAFIVRMEDDNRIIINQGANANISKERLDQSLDGNKDDLFLTQFEVPLYAVLDGLNKAKTLGMKTVVNPAPALVMDPEFYPLIDYLVVNQSESEILVDVFPENIDDCRRAFKVFSKRGVKHCVFTLGSNGSVFMSKDLELVESSFKVDVVDTTGAGDTFIGAFMHGLSEKWDMAKIMKYANGAGALACTKSGAQEGIPSFEELKNFIEASI